MRKDNDVLYNLIQKLDEKLNFSTVSAHCDIPCKIYDPIHAQLAVLTMIRMVDLINELQEKSELSLSDQAQFLRLVSQKEEHGIKVKKEITVIWGDFIKAPQLEKFPEIHQLVHSIMLAASSAKQHINKEATLSLLAKVNRFSEIFWQCKGFETYTAQCPYPPEQNLIYPVLTL
ncbi:MAG: superoxide dismutase, Ni [Colwellia sp.]|nr:superoxide dismutase, Ni [Colwellia sp.]